MDSTGKPRLVSVSIPTYNEEEVDKKKVIFYTLELNFNDTEFWKCFRRFSEFEKLAQTLSKTHQKLPPIPGKTLFNLSNKDDIERRRKGLETFMKAVCAREDMYCKKELIEFLDLERQQPSLQVSQITTLAEITHNKMGYRDAVFDLEHNYAVAVLHHTKVASRIDSYFNNLFAKKKATDEKADLDDKVTVGVLQFLTRSKGSKEITDFEMLWQKKYTSQPICVAVSHKLGIIVVGFDSGDMCVYSFNSSQPDDKKAVEESNLPKAHSGRVMKIVIDEKMERILSVADDKKFRVTSIKTKEPEHALKSIFDKGLTDLCFSSHHQIGFVADAGNSIYIIDMSSNPPSQSQKVKIDCSGPIRGIDIDWDSGLIFVSSISDGIISILKTPDIADPVVLV